MPLPSVYVNIIAMLISCQESSSFPLGYLTHTLVAVPRAGSRVSKAMVMFKHTAGLGILQGQGNPNESSISRQF